VQEARSKSGVPYPVVFVLIKHFVFGQVAALSSGNMQQMAQSQPASQMVQSYNPIALQA
jgi:hypothetical protein